MESNQHWLNPALSTKLQAGWVSAAHLSGGVSVGDWADALEVTSIPPHHPSASISQSQWLSFSL